MTRQAYPSDISDEKWAIVAPSITLMTANASQRTHSLREVSHGLRWVVRTGAAWRLMPHDLPPWYTVYQQSQRWLKAGASDDRAWGPVAGEWGGSAGADAPDVALGASGPCWSLPPRPFPCPHASASGPRCAPAQGGDVWGAHNGGRLPGKQHAVRGLGDVCADRRRRADEPGGAACLRPGGLWRQGSVGTQSAAGSRVVEARMAVGATRRQPHRTVLA